MRGCPQLSRLTRKKTLKSLNFNRVTPGSIGSWAGGPSPPTNFVDPSHPWAYRGSRAMRNSPTIDTPSFQLRAIPKAVLYVPEKPQDSDYAPSEWPKDRRVNMSILVFSPKSKVHKAACIRKTIVRRIYSAFTLVATRGADAEKDEKGDLVVTFKESDIGKHWISQDWTYLLWPKLEAYKMPWPELIQQGRKALSDAAKFFKITEKKLAEEQSTSMRSKSKPSIQIRAKPASSDHTQSRRTPSTSSARRSPSTPSSSSPNLPGPRSTPVPWPQTLTQKPLHRSNLPQDSGPITVQSSSSAPVSSTARITLPAARPLIIQRQSHIGRLSHPDIARSARPSLIIPSSRVAHSSPAKATPSRSLKRGLSSAATSSDAQPNVMKLSDETEQVPRPSQPDPHVSFSPEPEDSSNAPSVDDPPMMPLDEGVIMEPMRAEEDVKTHALDYNAMAEAFDEFHIGKHEQDSPQKPQDAHKDHHLCIPISEVSNTDLVVAPSPLMSADEEHALQCIRIEPYNATWNTDHRLAEEVFKERSSSWAPLQPKFKSQPWSLRSHAQSSKPSTTFYDLQPQAVADHANTTYALHLKNTELYMQRLELEQAVLQLRQSVGLFRGRVQQLKTQLEWELSLVEDGSLERLTSCYGHVAQLRCQAVELSCVITQLRQNPLFTTTPALPWELRWELAQRKSDVRKDRVWLYQTTRAMNLETCQHLSKLSQKVCAFDRMVMSTSKKSHTSVGKLKSPIQVPQNLFDSDTLEDALSEVALLTRSWSRSRRSKQSKQLPRPRKDLHTSACAHKHHSKRYMPIPAPNVPAEAMSKDLQPPQSPTAVTDYHTALDEVLSAQVWVEQSTTIESLPATDPESPAGKMNASRQWVEEALFVRALLRDQVERQKDVREAQKRMLAQLGFRVTKEENAAAEKAQEQSPLTLEELRLLSDKKRKASKIVGKEVQDAKATGNERSAPSSLPPDRRKQSVDDIVDQLCRIVPAAKPAEAVDTSVSSSSATPSPVPLVNHGSYRPKAASGKLTMSTTAHSRSFSSTPCNLQRRLVRRPRADVTGSNTRDLWFRATGVQAQTASAVRSDGNEEDDDAVFKRLCDMAARANLKSAQTILESTPTQEDGTWNILLNQLERKDKAPQTDARSKPEESQAASRTPEDKESRDDVQRFLAIDPFEAMGITPPTEKFVSDESSPRKFTMREQGKTARPRNGFSQDAPRDGDAPRRPKRDGNIRTERRTYDEASAAPKVGDRRPVAKQHASAASSDASSPQRIGGSGSAVKGLWASKPIFHATTTKPRKKP